MSRLCVISPQPDSLLSCVLNTNPPSTSMLLIAALGVPQAYKSKAASQTDTQKNSSTSVRAQAMPEDLFTSCKAIPSQREGWTEAYCPREGNWQRPSVSWWHRPPWMIPHGAWQQGAESSCPPPFSLNTSYIMRLPAPHTLFGQGPWKPQGITFSDVFDAEGTATITCSFITSTRWSARSSPGAHGQGTNGSCESCNRHLGKFGKGYKGYWNHGKRSWKNETHEGQLAVVQHAGRDDTWVSTERLQAGDLI